MKLPVQFFEVLRNRITVSSVVGQKLNLQRRGPEFTGLCPFHSEKSPSFTVNDHKRFYHCFGCGAHGDVIKFASETQGISYSDAAAKLADEFGIELPKMSPQEQKKYEESEEVLHILKLAAGIYHQFLLEEIPRNEELKAYIEYRGITADIIKEFKLGYVPNRKFILPELAKHKISPAMMHKAGLLGNRDNNGYYEIFKHRLMFPIFNLYNKVIGFGGRALGDVQPKYLNSPETIVFKKGESFYNEDKAFSHGYKSGYIIVVEGYMDLIKISAAGFKNAVASLGTAFTASHLQKIWRSIDEVALCFDGDKAGVGAISKAIQTALPLIKSPQRISAVFLPDKMDPDDYLAKNGEGGLRKLIEDRVPLSEAVWHLETLGVSLAYPEDRAELETRLNAHIEQVTDQSLKWNLKNYYKDKLWKIGRDHKRHTSKSTSSNDNLAATPNFSQRESIIIGLLSLILNNIELRSEDNIEFLGELESENPLVEDWKNVVIEKLQQDKNFKDVEQLIKDTGFLKLYEVLSLAKLSDIDSKIDNESDFCNITWQVLTKQYQLLLLQEEYVHIISSNGDNIAEKALLYQKEILSIQQQIAELRRI